MEDEDYFTPLLEARGCGLQRLVVIETVVAGLLVLILATLVARL